ncbi:hypothetical protein [Streptomyces sp. NPDC008121]|uniref:hypothetical protein n=1 Tax=Streptomyces sp. NPDC008121 TaxID=3364809 RepID=UPI0036E4B3FF
MTAQAVRPLLSTAVATLALGAAALAGAPAAVAAPGDNGDVKVHHAGRPDEPPRSPENDQRHEPKVCTFYFAALSFDGLQSLSWTISPQPPRGGVVRSGAITIDSEGNGFTPDLELGDGTYKVEWTWAGQLGAKKSKIFKVDCADFLDGPNGGQGGNGDNHRPGSNGDNHRPGDNGGGNGHQGRPPQGPVGAGGGGSAELAGDESSAFGVGTALAAGLAGTAGLILVRLRRSRRRTDGAA